MTIDSAVYSYILGEEDYEDGTIILKERFLLILKPITYFGMAYFGYCVFSGCELTKLEAKIQNILFPYGELGRAGADLRRVFVHFAHAWQDARAHSWHLASGVELPTRRWSGI